MVNIEKGMADWLFQDHYEWPVGANPYDRAKSPELSGFYSVTSKGELLFAKEAGHTPCPVKPGKFLKHLCPELAKDCMLVESFTNKFKARFNASPTIEVWSGEQLLDSYRTALYESKNESPLWRSCMNDDICYLDLYRVNPEVVQAVVMLTQKNKIMARALLWRTTKGTVVLDRVYAHYPHLTNMMHVWAADRGYYYRDQQGLASSLTFTEPCGENAKTQFCVQLSSWENLSEYPYVDSFCHFDSSAGTLRTKDNHNHNRVLDSTSGRYSTVSGRCSGDDDDYDEENDDSLVWSDYLNRYIDADNAAWASYEQSQIEQDDLERTADHRITFVSGSDDFGYTSSGPHGAGYYRLYDLFVDGNGEYIHTENMGDYYHHGDTDDAYEAGHLPARWYGNTVTNLQTNQEWFLTEDGQLLEEEEAVEAGLVEEKPCDASANPNQLSIQFQLC